MREEFGNERHRPEAEIEQDGASRPMDMNHLAKMSLEELLYYVLVSDGKRLRIGSV